jgi:hypothetical protein
VEVVSDGSKEIPSHVQQRENDRKAKRAIGFQEADQIFANQSISKVNWKEVPTQRRGKA